MDQLQTQVPRGSRLPALKAKLHYPMQDVSAASILTIAHIAGPFETDCYAKALLDPTYKAKGQRGDEGGSVKPGLSIQTVSRPVEFVPSVRQSERFRDTG